MKRNRLILLSWELPQEKMEDGRPFSVSKRYTFSAHEKATFRKDLESWRAKAFTADELKTFDISRLLHKACMLTIAHKETDNNTYANIVAISPPVKGMTVPTESVNEAFCFAMDPSVFNPALLEKMSEKLQTMIKSSDEWKAITMGQKPNSGGQQQMDAFDDEIPF